MNVARVGKGSFKENNADGWSDASLDYIQPEVTTAPPGDPSSCLGDTASLRRHAGSYPIHLRLHENDVSM